jgi:peptidoglycan/LPS O-acetylase OafA/YrhL
MAGNPKADPSTATAPGRASTASRIAELDSVRGIAACVVVVGHVASVAGWLDPGASGVGYWLKSTPLGLPFTGTEAVIVFFVLSGFVLSLPYLAQRGDSYRGFLVRRVMRIYIPYLVAVGLAIGLALALRSGRAPESVWFDRQWLGTPDASSIVGHLLLIPSFHSSGFNPVIWSLVQEMRISLIFPLLFLVTVRLPWGAVLAGALVLGAAGNVLSHASEAAGWANDYFDTLHYLVMFVAGILLARHSQAIRRLYARLSRSGRLGLAILTFLALSYPFLARSAPIAHRGPLDDWMVGLGACLVIVIASSSEGAARWLRIRPAVFVGRISYSLFLLHVPVILATVILLSGTLPLWAILVIAVVASFVLATVMYELVERPAVDLGRRAGRRLRVSKRSHAPAAPARQHAEV